MDSECGKIAIIGGGAAGLYLAALFARAGLGGKVTLVEAGARLGKKLSASGNGQGNVSHTDMSAAHYHGGGARLAFDIITDTGDVLSLFGGIFTADDRGRIYPAGRQASALTDDLRVKIERGGVTVMLNERVTGISRGFSLPLSGGGTLKADTVVLACGGSAQKQFGTGGGSYALARSLGHEITPLFPSLVQLKTDTARIKTLKGLRTDARVTAFSGSKPLGSGEGEIIFADYGVTGSAVFAVSPKICGKTGVTLSVDLAPALTETQISDDIARKLSAGCAADKVLDLTFHRTLARAVLSASPSRAEIARTAKNFPLTVTGTLGFDHAQVTRGGVDMRGVTDKLESKTERGLFFAGEVLDVDGDCGGYNLHWAFASAKRVFDEIMRRRNI